MQYSSVRPGTIFLIGLFCSSIVSATTVAARVGAAPSLPLETQQLISNPLTGLDHDGESWDLFGSSLAVSNGTALIGAPLDSIAASGTPGSAYVFVKTGDEWVMQAKLTAPDLSDSAGFGRSVAISGSLAIVGATSTPNDAGLPTGGAFVFQRQGEQWQFIHRLIPQGAAADDQFGWRVAISNNTALVSSTKHLDASTGVKGKVAVFQFDGAAWTESAPWISEASVNVGFGAALALQGNLALVGSPGNERVDVYEKVDSVWQRTRALSPPDDHPAVTVNRFGETLAMDGGIAIVGAPQTEVVGEAQTGSAFQYDISNDWALVRMHRSQLPDSYWFGSSLAIHSNRLLVRSRSIHSLQSHLHLMSLEDGAAVAELTDQSEEDSSPIALNDSDILVGRSSADVPPNIAQGYVARFNEDPAGTWTPAQPLTSGNGGHGQSFGRSVAISGDTAVIGVDQDDVENFPFVGTAYVFQRNNGAWVYHSRLVPPDLDSVTLGARSVDIDGDTIVVGGYRGRNGNPNAAYVFVRENAIWQLQQKITEDLATPSNGIGRLYSLSGDLLVIGEPDRIGPSGQTGAAQVFRRNNGIWSHDAQLLPSDGGEGDRFGYAVDVRDNRILIGAPFKDGPAGNADGAAYLYEHGVSGWTAAASWQSDGDDSFGASVALGNQFAAVTATHIITPGVGSVHVFRNNGEGWAQESQFAGFDTLPADYFGCSLDIDGNTMIVGARDRDGFRGAAYLFHRGATGWTQIAQYLPPATSANSLPMFGEAVAISRTTLVLSLPQDAGVAPWGNPSQGAVEIIDDAVTPIFFDGFD